MPRTIHQDPHPFLTIVSWPGGYDRRQLAQLLADCSGLDPHDLRYRLGQPPPMILGQIEADIAQRAIAGLTQRDGDAFAITLDDPEDRRNLHTNLHTDRTNETSQRP